MPNRKLALVHAAAMEAFHYPQDCPFRPERAARARERIHALSLFHPPAHIEATPEPATRSEIELYHRPEYLDELERAAKGDLTLEGLHMGLGQPDTPVFPGLFEIARWSAGATLAAADLLNSGQVDVAFNFAGGFHHATAAKASGFCYVNDVVLGCLRLLQKHPRVAFLDIDAHHGDGVQDAFYHRADLLTVSLHESGKTLYPGTGFEDEIGRGPGEGCSVNIPLPAGTYDEAYLRAFREVALPILRAYQPDALVVEFGMDTLAGDPLTHLTLTNQTHADLIPLILALGKPVLVTGGGGYHVENTIRGWALAWKTFSDQADEHDWGFGLGGVMLESTEWSGGLLDRFRPVTEEQRRSVLPALQQTIADLQTNVFPRFGLAAR